MRPHDEDGNDGSSRQVQEAVAAVMHELEIVILMLFSMTFTAY
jgi:hypothetical protein